MLPPLFNKYTLEHVHRNPSNHQMDVFSDIDGDSITELIRLGHESWERKAFPFVMIRSNYSIRNMGGDFMSQYNLQRQWLQKTPVKVTDCNNDNLNEIVLFTSDKDSLFLTVISPFTDSTSTLSTFLMKVSFREDVPDFQVFDGGFYDFDKDGTDEYLFTVTAGFSALPRHLCIYDFNDNKLKTSKTAHAAFYFSPRALVFAGRGVYRIVSDCYAPDNLGNNKSSSYPDSCAWFTVFDENLRTLFPPKKLAIPTGYVKPFFLNQKNDWKVAAFYNASTKRHTTDSLVLYDKRGNKTNKLTFPAKERWKVMTGLSTNSFIMHSQDKIVRYDSQFNKLSESSIDRGMQILMIADINNDGIKDVVVRDNTLELLTVLDPNLNHAVSAPLAMDKNHLTLSTTRFTGNFSNLVIDSGDFVNFYHYHRNPYYFLRFPFYIAIYSVLSLFFYLLLSMQRTYLKNKYDQEQKIMQLELMTIHNQINPHFMFNAINAAGSLIYSGDKNNAYYYLIDIASLLRNSLNNSRKTAITLKEELEFVGNYLNLQQFRYNNYFEYIIRIEDQLNTSVLVPKMIIQTFAENAVKHGLITRKQKGGLLEMSVKKELSQLIIVIEDNGIGRAASQNKYQQNTGKGLEIIDQIIELYNRLTKVRVSYEIVDKKDAHRKAAGTKVIVKVPLRNHIKQHP